MNSPDVTFVKKALFNLWQTEPRQSVFSFTFMLARKFGGVKNSTHSVMLFASRKILRGLADFTQEADGARQLFQDFAPDGLFGLLAGQRAAARQKEAALATNCGNSPVAVRNHCVSRRARLIIYSGENLSESRFVNRLFTHNLLASIKTETAHERQA